VEENGVSEKKAPTYSKSLTHNVLSCFHRYERDSNSQL